MAAVCQAEWVTGGKEPQAGRKYRRDALKWIKVTEHTERRLR